MRNTIILILVATAVLSPFVFPEILHAPGITKLSLFEACVYTSIVAVIIILGLFIIKHFVPNKTYLLLCESYVECNYSLIGLFQKKGLKIIPKTIDYFSTQYKEKEDELKKSLNHSSGAIVIIGEHSSKPQFFHQMIKI